MKKLHRLRIWSSKTASTKIRFFLKPQIIVGSDRTADLRLADLEGLHFQIDLEHQEVLNLVTGEQSKFTEDALFQLDSYIAQYKAYDRIPRVRMTYAGAAAASVFLALMVWMAAGQMSGPECTAREMKVSSGYWGPQGASDQDKLFFGEIQGLKKSFQAALKSKNWVKAKADLREIEQVARPEKILPEACRVDQVLSDFNVQLSESVAKDHLKNQRILEAASELAQLPDESKKVQQLKRRIIREAQKLYFDGYAKEDDDSDKGYEMMEAAREICDRLKEDRECFRKANVTQTANASTRLE